MDLILKRGAINSAPNPNATVIPNPAPIDPRLSPSINISPSPISSNASNDPVLQDITNELKEVVAIEEFAFYVKAGNLLSASKSLQTAYEARGRDFRSFLVSSLPALFHVAPPPYVIDLLAMLHSKRSVLWNADMIAKWDTAIMDKLKSKQFSSAAHLLNQVDTGTS